MNTEESKIPKKRGRKSKLEKEQEINNNVSTNDDNTTYDPPSKEPPKKRGRKPKGGKIIQPNQVTDNTYIPEHNIILHLKCKTSDLQLPFFNSINYEPNIPPIDSYQFENSDLRYQTINESENRKININNDIVDTNDDNKELWKKLDELTINLHNNNICDKKSACFWCTYDFDNPPIYIPKYELNGTYYCYGCFCSPECAVAHLFKESLDSTARFERFHLINHIYCKIYNYKKNIKPAPDPFYLLNKYYGTLSIQEYRKLLKNERLLLIVDKPLTRILPELHDDNDEFVLNTQIIPSAKFKLRKKSKQTKSEILNEKFNLK